MQVSLLGLRSTTASRQSEQHQYVINRLVLAFHTTLLPLTDATTMLTQCPPNQLFIFYIIIFSALILCVSISNQKVYAQARSLTSLNPLDRVK